MPPEFSFQPLQGEIAGLAGVWCLGVGGHLGLLACDMGVGRDFAGFQAEGEFEVVGFVKLVGDATAVVFEDLVEGFVVLDVFETEGHSHAGIHIGDFLPWRPWVAFSPLYHERSFR